MHLSAFLIFVLFLFVFWEKCNTVLKTSYQVIYAIQDSICYKNIQNLYTLQNIYFTQINQTYVLSTDPPPSPIYFDHTNVSISYFLDKIKMLDYTKNGSFIFKSDRQCISFFFFFCTNSVLIGVLRHKGRFRLGYTLVS